MAEVSMCSATDSKIMECSQSDTRAASFLNRARQERVGIASLGYVQKIICHS